MDKWLLLSLLISHVVGDFYLQPNKWCEAKNGRKLNSCYLYIHPIVIGLLAWGITWAFNFWPYALLLTITHWIIDAVKVHFKPSLVVFSVDQLLHLGVMVGIAYQYTGNGVLPLEAISFSESISIPLLVLAVLVCLKPTNILIKLILDKYKIGSNLECEEIKNAGALIGNLERFIALIFVLLGQYEAIGFIIASKSILRFKETDTAKTEYVLAGTFLSFGIAVICGIFIQKIAPYFM